MRVTPLQLLSIIMAMTSLTRAQQLSKGQSQLPGARSHSGKVMVTVDPLDQPESLQDLIQSSAVIAIGHVNRSLPTRLTNPLNDGSIETPAEIAVEKYLKGAQTDSILVVCERGGEYGGVHAVVAGDIPMKAGERYVLFLRPSKRSQLIDSRRAFYIAGIFTGKFRVDSRQRIIAHSSTTDSIKALSGATVADLERSILAVVK